MNAKLVLCCLLHLLIQLGSSSSHDHHHDSSVAIFFFPEDLKLGNTLEIYFPKRELSDLLSKEEADSIPFSSQQLPQILRLFSFSDDSPQATAMAATLDECDRQPIQGEKKFCATSQQSMSEFLDTIFGSETPIKALATSQLRRSSTIGEVQEYRILGIRRIPSPEMVSCHTMPYAYTVFYCHYHNSDNRVFRVSLEGRNGDEVDAIAVCHMDTSQWGPTHVAFRLLGVEPGSTPVCHFFPEDNFVWVPVTSSAAAEED